MMNVMKRKGFTVIELLIVIVIVAIFFLIMVGTIAAIVFGILAMTGYFA